MSDIPEDGIKYPGTFQSTTMPSVISGTASVVLSRNLVDAFVVLVAVGDLEAVGIQLFCLN